MHAARAGAEHFAFRHVDDFPNVLRKLVAPAIAEPPHRLASGIDDLEQARTRVELRRAARRNRYSERAPAAVLSMLPATVSPLLRRIIHACLASIPPETVDELAARIAMQKRSLTRDVARRGWPAPHVLLKWGRLFRGAAAGFAARMDGTNWEEAQWVIAVEAGYGSVRTASRAYRSRAGVGLRELWRDGAGALLPAFLAAVSDTPPHRLAS